MEAVQWTCRRFRIACGTELAPSVTVTLARERLMNSGHETTRRKLMANALASRALPVLWFVGLGMVSPAGIAAPVEDTAAGNVPSSSASAGEAVIQRDGKVAFVTTSADGVRRYVIKAAPAREFSMRIGQSVRPIADPCGDALMPR